MEKINALLMLFSGNPIWSFVLFGFTVFSLVLVARMFWKKKKTISNHMYMLYM
ncbi:MAG: cbb3-type cytochrome oxidase subunit 3 [Candidatus Paceibacteria bacterium]|jgi:cbb3-type cytochrome oxidase subunit 3